MSATIVRLMLSFITVAATPAVYFLVLVIAYETQSSGWNPRFMFALWAATAVTAIALAAAWIGIWYGEVRWTPRRVVTTCLMTVGAIVGALPVGLGMGAWEEEVGVIAGGIAWALLWLTGATLAWRETAAERGERLQTLGIRAIACPKCGYNLTGLKQSVCPECGASYTLDQLFASLTEVKGALPEEAKR
jgi:hypothetical protein